MVLKTLTSLYDLGSIIRRSMHMRLECIEIDVLPVCTLEKSVVADSLIMFTSELMIVIRKKSVVWTNRVEHLTHGDDERRIDSFGYRWICPPGPG